MNLHKRILATILITIAASGIFSSCSVFHPNGFDFHVHTDDTPQEVGYSKFVVHLMDKDTGVEVSGANLTVQPVMPDMGHATPVESVVDNGDGTYTAKVYYVMGGTWAINLFVDGVDIGQSEAYVVGGSMMDKGVLKGITGNDEVYGGNRNYHIFKRSLVSGNAGSDTVDLYLASFEDMMTFPIVYSGQVLHNDVGENVKTAGAWTVGTITLSICSVWSGTACTDWTDLQEDMTNRGHFTASKITIANTGTSMMSKFAVRLHESTTNEWKTTDGAAGAGTGEGATEFKSINQ